VGIFSPSSHDLLVVGFHFPDWISDSSTSDICQTKHGIAVLLYCSVIATTTTTTTTTVTTTTKTVIIAETVMYEWASQINI